MSASSKKRVQAVGGCLFAVYMAMLIYFLFFSENFGRGTEGGFYSCNFYPFREIRRFLVYWEIIGLRNTIINLGGNIVGFMPFGALLPVLAKEARRAWRTALLSFEVSALVEVTQLIFHVGCFDVDDIILNTLGGLLGYFVFWMLRRGVLHCNFPGSQQRKAARTNGPARSWKKRRHILKRM